MLQFTTCWLLQIMTEKWKLWVILPLTWYAIYQLSITR